MEELQELVASRLPSSVETVNDPQNNTYGETEEVRKEEHEDETSPTLWISSVLARTTTTEDDDADHPQEPQKKEHADDVSAESEGEQLSQTLSENNTTKDGNGDVERDEDVDSRSFLSSGVSHSSDRTPATVLLTDATISNHGSHRDETRSDPPACPIVPIRIPTRLPSGVGYDAAASIPDVDSDMERANDPDDDEDTAAARVGIYHGADADVQGDATAAADGNRNDNTEEFLLIPTFPGGDVTKIAFKKSFLLNPVLPGRTTKILWRSRL